MFQKFAYAVAGDSISANTASFLGSVFVAAVVIGICFSPSYPILLLVSPIFVLFRFIMNALDGMIARARNTATPAGELMNEVLDVVGDQASYLILLTIFDNIVWPMIALINAIWLCEFIGVLGKSFPNGRRRQESLLGGKPERAVWLCLVLAISYFNPKWMNSYAPQSLILLTLFVLASTGLRIRAILEGTRNQVYKSDPLIGR